LTKAQPRKAEIEKKIKKDFEALVTICSDFK